jgi:hypothetical protein
MREAARRCGAEAVVIRTNLRVHPLTGPAPWESGHGGPLAAVGHLLSDEAGRLSVSASFPSWYPYTWGSHPTTDPLWSSGRLRVVHEGAQYSRLDKVRAIASHPLPQSSLRVCWENFSPTGNCSRCDKCLCTMALLEVCGALESFSVFAGGTALLDGLNALARTRFVMTYDEARRRTGNVELRDAIRRLLRRTAAVAAPPLERNSVGWWPRVRNWIARQRAA